MTSQLIRESDTYWVMLALVSSASLWFLLTYSREKFENEDVTGSILLGATHLLAILGLYRLTEDIGSLAVSASWLFYALGVIAFAYHRQDITMGKSALVVLSFAAAKALLYDVSSAAPVVRIFCLLMTGAVLYGSGFFIRKMSDWKIQ